MCRVLHVEDSAAQREVISAFFDHTPEQFKVELVQVGSVAEGVEALETCIHWDCVLLDLVLPDSSGIETVEAIKNLCPGLPVIVLSTIDDAETINDCLAMDVFAFIPKQTAAYAALPYLIRAAVERQKQRNKLRYALLAAQRRQDDHDKTLREIGAVFAQRSKAASAESKRLNDTLELEIAELEKTILMGAL